MKNILKIVGVMFLVALYGCEGDTNANNAVPENVFNEQATLQGTVFDAITGAKVTVTGLKVTLVQGTSYRNASVRTGTQDFAGDYALSGIPISINNQTEYRLVVSATGYQTFESTIAFDAIEGGSTSPIDRAYNYIGNVRLFPTGVNPNDEVINVSFNGEPVVGATVLLNGVTVNAIGTVTGTTGGTLFANGSNMYAGPLSAVTDASGNATFAAANLVLGGFYNISVVPLTHESITPITQSSFPSLSVGSSNVVLAVTMADLLPGANPDGLYATSASNIDPTAIASNGVLTIGLSRPVTLGTTPTVSAILTGATTAVLNAASATASLSSDGMTLTLTPSFATSPDPATDNGTLLTYFNVTVRIATANDSFSEYNVFGLTGPTGGIVSPTVRLTAQF